MKEDNYVPSGSDGKQTEQGDLVADDNLIPTDQQINSLVDEMFPGDSADQQRPNVILSEKMLSKGIWLIEVNPEYANQSFSELLFRDSKFPNTVITDEDRTGRDQGDYYKTQVPADQQIKSLSEQSQNRMLNILIDEGEGHLFSLSDRQIIFRAMEIYASEQLREKDSEIERLRKELETRGSE